MTSSLAFCQLSAHGWCHVCACAHQPVSAARVCNSCIASMRSTASDVTCRPDSSSSYLCSTSAHSSLLLVSRENRPTAIYRCLGRACMRPRLTLDAGVGGSPNMLVVHIHPTSRDRIHAQSPSRPMFELLQYRSQLVYCSSKVAAEIRLLCCVYELERIIWCG